MATDRLLAVTAGPFRLCFPLLAVRQILDVGVALPSAPGKNDTSSGPWGPPLVLAEVLGARAHALTPGHLLLDGPTGPLHFSVDAIHGVVTEARLEPMADTVRLRWPGLLLGTVRRPEMFLVLDPAVLVGIVEAEYPEAGG